MTLPVWISAADPATNYQLTVVYYRSSLPGGCVSARAFLKTVMWDISLRNPSRNSKDEKLIFHSDSNDQKVMK